MACSPAIYRVGVWIGESKAKRINLESFLHSFKSSDLEFFKINIDIPLADQGRIDAIVHKLSDVVVLAETGDRAAEERINNVYDYLHQHPEVVVIDPFKNIRPILNRYDTYQIVSNFISSRFADQFFVPSFTQIETSDQEVVLAQMIASGIRFPVLCKPNLSHGFDSAHEMSLVFHGGGLRQIQAPCVLQQFVNHGGVLYKTFAVGEVYDTAVRRSVRDLEAGPAETIHFSTGDVSKEGGRSNLVPVQSPSSTQDDAHNPNFQLLIEFSEALRRAIGLSLLGIDFIYDSATMRYGVIDVNAFPGYEKFPGFFDALLTVIRAQLASGSQSRLQHSA